MTNPEVSKIEEKLASKADQAETAAQSAALSVVNAEKGWFAKNWKAVAIGVALALVAVFIAHKL